MKAYLKSSIMLLSRGTEERFGEWAESFLIDRYSVDSPYGQLCQKGQRKWMEILAGE